MDFFHLRLQSLRWLFDRFSIKVTKFDAHFNILFGFEIGLEIDKHLSSLQNWQKTTLGF